MRGQSKEKLNVKQLVPRQRVQKTIYLVKTDVSSPPLPSDVSWSFHHMLTACLSRCSTVATNHPIHPYQIRGQMVQYYVSYILCIFIIRHHTAKEHTISTSSNYWLTLKCTPGELFFFGLRSARSWQTGKKRGEMEMSQQEERRGKKPDHDHAGKRAWTMSVYPVT
ncbi:hypothetical protein BGZ63DRAFT_91989 [Mariannaea sp. PMI_226]|nr:hypothetical protein BGZ63DRAFT_91989 [Mariannaea sp. PMI_226]